MKHNKTMMNDHPIYYNLLGMVKCVNIMRNCDVNRYETIIILLRSHVPYVEGLCLRNNISIWFHVKSFNIMLSILNAAIISAPTFIGGLGL